MSLNSGSHCPDGDAHSSGDGGNYYLCINNASTNSGLGQIGWRWCSKCQGLWMAFDSGSKCSADGLAHIANGSGAYVLSFDSN